jgi:hypothetical protein
MRTIVSILVACALFVLVGYLAYSGIIILSDFWTGVAVVLVATALGVLYWGFRPQIGRLFKEKRSGDESEAETVSARYQVESEEKHVKGTIRQPVSSSNGNFAFRGEGNEKKCATSRQYQDYETQHYQ